MKAYRIEEPNKGRTVTMEPPVPAEDEVLIEVKAVGLCGTDIHIYKGEYFGTYPRVPGHEFSGVVAAVGKNVESFQVGQRVSADPNAFCEACPVCQQNNQNFCEHLEVVGVSRDGGFAQYVTVPVRCVFDTTGISFTEAAMIEPLSCCVYGQQCVRPPLSSRVLIIGAGPIGLMHVQLAKINGAASVTVVDLFPEKLELAKSLGADEGYTPEDFDKTGPQGRFELVIDCTGVPKVIENAVQYVKSAGTFLLFGVCPNDSRISVNPYEIFNRQLTLTSTFALKKTFGLAKELVKNRRVELLPLIGRKLELDEVPALFEEVSGGNAGMKNLCYPNGIEKL